MFGLDAAHLTSRIEATGTQRVWPAPSLIQSVSLAALGFSAASMIVFATVAMAEQWLYGQFGQTGAYVFWTGLFILTAGLLLEWLAAGPGARLRFFGFFAVAFTLYAAGWVISYFTFQGRTGEWMGAAIGTALFACYMNWEFKASQFFKVFLVLFLAHSLGYFAGAFLAQQPAGRSWGLLLWGITYGLVFGAGLGYAIYIVQEPLRTALRRRGQGGNPSVE